MRGYGGNMSKTFTDTAKKRYEKACEENKGQNEFYHCATSTDVTKRNLDLNSKFVFCKRCSGVSKNNEIREYKLQAFMIRKALKATNHRMLIKGKEWTLLDAERRFTKDDLSEVGHGERLDILAYEKSTLTYIVLELKIDRSFKKANEELLRYTSTIKNHIDEANEYYSVDAKNVQGYIVWPSNGNPRKQDNQWGLIEYDKKNLVDIEHIKLDVVKEPS